MRSGPQAIRKALRCAFPHTIPIFAGFCFLGMTYGVYMNVSGFSFWYPMLMSMTVFAGSMEFVAVNLLLGAFDPLQALVITLTINARHLFYGISMLDKFRGLGWKKPYLIFGLCDETFSINYTADVPDGMDRGWFMFFVTLLNQCYWSSPPFGAGWRGEGRRHDPHPAADHHRHGGAGHPAHPLFALPAAICCWCSWCFRDCVLGQEKGPERHWRSGPF